MIARWAGGLLLKSLVQATIELVQMEASGGFPDDLD
jgi:hypothetical protein